MIWNKFRFNSWVIDNFWLTEEQMTRLKEQSDFFDLDISKALNWYDDYLETNLVWKLNRQIIDKIYLSIWRRFLKLSWIIEELKEEEISKYWNLDNFKDAKWIINTRMKDNLSFVDNQLLPSASLYTHFAREKDNKRVLQDWKWNLNMLSKYSREWDMVWLSFTWIDTRLKEIEEMFDSDVDENWDFDEGTFSTQNIYDASDEEQVKRYFHWRKIEKVDWINILNEEDEAIQKKVDMWVMWACLLLK